MTERIFLSAPDVRAYERDFVMAAIDSNWLAPAGPALDAFEKDLAAVTGRDHAIGLSSGTAAIHLALVEMGIGPGDHVLCSTFTFAGSAFPIMYLGATPVFIDSEVEGWNLDPDLLEAELHERAGRNELPAAAIVVDLYGNCARYDRLCELLDHYGVPMVEDAAEAVGARFNGRPAGSFGAHAVLSFNGNKIVTSSGGGALVTDDAEFAARVRHLSTQARENERFYEHVEVGYNYRLSNICAALGRAQLMTLGERIERRRIIAQHYQDLFEPIDGIDMLEPVEGSTSNHWLSCITLDPNRSPVARDELITALEAENIESRPLWKPMHLQPVFAQAPRRVNGTSESLFLNGVCLPSGSGMTDQDIDRVLVALHGALAHRSQ